MAVSADLVQIAIVAETEYGVTPATPVFDILGITDESLVGSADSELSTSLTASRQDLDSILKSLDVSGSLNFEFAKSPAMTLMLESAVGKDTATDGNNRNLIVGQDLISFTVEKKFPDPVNAGQFLYHRYSGCLVDTFTLTMSAGEKITGTSGLIGKQLTTDTAILTGATYVSPTTFNIFSSPDVTQIILDNEEGTLAPTITDSCVTDITINLANNARGIQCLGFLGNKQTALGKFNCNYDQTILFSSNSIMDDFLSQDYLNEIITVGDTTGDDFYTFITTKGKFANNDVVAGGTGTDVANAHSINWLYDNTLVDPTTIEISTSLGRAAPTFQSGATGSSTTVVLTFDYDCAVTDGTGFDVQVDASGNIITGATASTNTITLTLTTPVTAGQVITVAYDGTGNATNLGSGLSMLAFAAQPVTNNVV